MSAVYAPLLLSALAFIISVVSFFYFRSYLKHRTSQQRILSELREEVNSIVRSIDAAADRDISLIEEQETKLKSLLAEIEKRLKVYIREMEKRPIQPSSFSPAKSEAAYQDLGKNRYRLNGQGFPQPAESTPASPVSPAPPVLPAESGNPLAAGAPATANAAFPLPNFRVKPGQAEAGETPAALPPVGERIRELVRAGFTAPVIASRLGISIAEVEFAAALLERRDA